MLLNVQKKASKDSKASKNKEPDIPSTPKITSVFDKKTSSSPPDFLSQLPANFTPFAGTGRKLGSASTPAVPVGMSSVESKVDNKATVTSSSTNTSLLRQKDISTYFTRPFTDLSSESKVNNKATVSSSSPNRSMLGHKDISTYFNKPFSDLSSGSKVNNKATVSSSSPKDISTYFTRPFSDFSSESKVDNKATVTSSSPNNSLLRHKDISTYFTKPFLDLSSESNVDNKATVMSSSPNNSLLRHKDISTYFTKPFSDLSSESKVDNKATVMSSSPNNSLLRHKDISTYFTKPFSDLSSESKVDNKATVTSSSPNKSLVGHKDISTYFTRPFLDLSSDSELYISSPPSKRKRVDPPKKESVACPICNKTGFADLNMHANICLNNQLMDSSENNSSHSSKKIKYPVSILDSSIEEIPVLKQSKTGKASIKDYLNSSSVSDHCPSALPSTSSVSSPQSSGTRGDSRTCPVCGKAVTTDMTTHLKVCIDSIPGDDNEVVILDEINQPNTSGENNKTAAVAVDFVECPICGRKFRQSMINTHLDLECLSFREFL